MWTEYLEHSKGPWKKHKYIRKVGDRYYYTTETDDSKIPVYGSDGKTFYPMRAYDKHERHKYKAPQGDRIFRVDANGFDIETGQNIYEKKYTVRKGSDGNTHLTRNDLKNDLHKQKVVQNNSAFREADKEASRINEFNANHKPAIMPKPEYKIVSETDSMITPKSNTSKDKVEVNTKKTEPILPGVTSKISELGTNVKETVEKGKNFLNNIFGKKK